MRGIIRLKRLVKTNYPHCIVSEKDYDEKLGGEFYMLLEPLDFNGKPRFYWQKLPDGTYEVEGEGYIVPDTREIAEHKRYVAKWWKDTTLEWNEVKGE